MAWTVEFTQKAAKQLESLPGTVRSIALLLVKEIEIGGPVRGNWKNYGKLAKGEHHCHLKSGRPTYVACWRDFRERLKVKGKVQEVKKVEVYYVGSHEKAPY